MVLEADAKIEDGRVARYKKLLPDSMTDTEKNETLEELLKIAEICFNEYVKTKNNKKIGVVK